MQTFNEQVPCVLDLISAVTALRASCNALCPVGVAVGILSID